MAESLQRYLLKSFGWTWTSLSKQITLLSLSLKKVQILRKCLRTFLKSRKTNTIELVLCDWNEEEKKTAGTVMHREDPNTNGCWVFYFYFFYESICHLKVLRRLIVFAHEKAYLTGCAFPSFGLLSLKRLHLAQRTNLPLLL